MKTLLYTSLIFLFFMPLYSQQGSSNSNCNELKKEIVDLKAENQQLKLEIANLRNGTNNQPSSFTYPSSQNQGNQTSSHQQTFNPNTPQPYTTEHQQNIAENQNSEAEVFHIKKQVELALNANKPTIPIHKLPIFNNEFDIFIIDFSKPGYKTKTYWKDPNQVPYGSLGYLKSKLDQSGDTLVFATNGGMYNPNRSPKGLFVQNGIKLRDLDLGINGQGNFYLQPNGVFLINKNNQPLVIPTREYASQYMAQPPQYATQSGPMLVTNGQINGNFSKNSNNLYLRSGVGTIDGSRVAFVISRNPVSFYEFARVFRDILGCQNALFLDGAVSKMYAPDCKRYDDTGEFGAIIGITKEK